ncbi:hypothetical protein [Saccharothrix sp. ALI-22-I]|uniref:hypothetical protein n=1 Tax=Saccharothrix sp. ALI-22-I TaxID=1933778 RepID=UPI001930ECD0
MGAASGAFANVPPPSLVPVESSAAFIEAYQELRGRAFTAEEWEIAWAGACGRRCTTRVGKVLHGDAPVSLNAVREQAAERLRRANC